MRTAIVKPTRQRQGLRPGRRRRVETVRPSPAREPRPEPADQGPPTPEERSRREGGPQDAALFVCRCGSAFQAPVTASVGCPHCGEPQAW